MFTRALTGTLFSLFCLAAPAAYAQVPVADSGVAYIPSKTPSESTILLFRGNAARLLKTFIGTRLSQGVSCTTPDSREPWNVLCDVLVSKRGAARKTTDADWDVHEWSEFKIGAASITASGTTYRINFSGEAAFHLYDLLVAGGSPETGSDVTTVTGPQLTCSRREFPLDVPMYVAGCQLKVNALGKVTN